MPEPFVPVCRELTVAGEALERRPLPDRVVAVDVVDHARRQNEEAAIDAGVVAGRLLLEARHPIAVHLERAEAAGRRHRGDGGEAALGPMESEQRRYVDIGDT